jgi:hypothetical protein
MGPFGSVSASSPLYEAAAKGYSVVVDILLSAGADPKTALARVWDHSELSARPRRSGTLQHTATMKLFKRC